MSTVASPRTTYRARTRIPLSALIVAVAASAVNSIIALVATSLGLESTGGLQPMSFIAFTVIAAIAGAFGWHLINRYSRRPSAIMRWLVPAFLVVSFIPDVIVATTMGWAFAGALMLMHLATITIGVATYSRLMPLHAAASQLEEGSASPA